MLGAAATGNLTGIRESTGAEYYTPQRIAYWLRNWPLLESLAETPHSSAHHLHHGDDDDRRPCMPAPHVSRTGYAPDPLRYCDVLADLAGAIARLPNGDLAWAVLGALRASPGASLGEIANALRRRKDDVCRAKREAVASMARGLGWHET